MDFDKTQSITVGTFRKTGEWHDINAFFVEENSKCGWKEHQAVLPSYIVNSGRKYYTVIQSNDSLTTSSCGHPIQYRNVDPRS